MKRGDEFTQDGVIFRVTRTSDDAMRVSINGTKQAIWVPFSSFINGQILTWRLQTWEFRHKLQLANKELKNDKACGTL